MPLGEVLAEFVVHVVFEGLFKWVISPVLRFPGALVGWLIWRGRPFSIVWLQGDGFAQGTVGVAIYMTLIFTWLAIIHG